MKIKHVIAKQVKKGSGQVFIYGAICRWTLSPAGLYQEKKKGKNYD